MFPVIAIGPIILPTYPLSLLVALWAGNWLASRRASQLQLDANHVYNVTLYGLLAGFIGARFWYVITHWDSYIGQPSQALTLAPIALAGGEGLAMAGLVIFIYLQRQHVPLGTFADALAPGLILAALMGHWGYFLSGQALGHPTTLPWAITIANVARHPAELYEALGCLLILIILFVSHRYLPWAGFQFWLSVALYGLSRLALEPFHEQPELIGSALLMGQVVGLLVAVVALAVMAYNFTSQPTELGIRN